MPKMTFEITMDEILSQLSPSQIRELDQKIHEYLETQMMMRVAETGFSEWEDPEEDIYNESI